MSESTQPPNPKRRWYQFSMRTLLILVMLSCLGFLAAYYAETGVVWVGRHKLIVNVVVVDASSLSPVPNAAIEVLEGTDTLFEGGSPIVDGDFKVVDASSDLVRLTTNDDGYATFAHSFFATGRDSPFTESGNVKTSGIWLRITAPGYRPTLVPVDQQSTQSRDIQDESPILVTVPVGKQ